MYLSTSLPEITKTEHQFKSASLKRTVFLEFFIKDQLATYEKLNLLLLNDGQDVKDLQLEQTLIDLYAKRSIDPIVVVAIKASSGRLQEYGVAGVPDFQGRGSKCVAYTDFIVKELLPFIEKTLKRPIDGRRAFAGCSLGGLSAFDIAWNNDRLFDVVGVLSGSFWWRKKDLKDGYKDSDRIMHEVIRNHPNKPDLKFWLMTGTQDEKTDRNGNFIIDSIDDTIDVIKELLNKGYQRPQDIFYYECVGGEHNIGTWAKVLPAFICWAFSRNRITNSPA
jgi:enterochelin esterase-like enzyme